MQCLAKLLEDIESYTSIHFEQIGHPQKNNLIGDNTSLLYFHAQDYHLLSMHNYIFLKHEEEDYEEKEQHPIQVLLQLDVLNNVLLWLYLELSSSHFPHFEHVF